MKRTLIAAAAVLAAGTAFAQTSVQLYGRVNTSVEYQKDSTGSKYVLQDSNSRWGLRGSEDLGSGLKALFVLESGFSSDTGTAAGALFQRESWVGLESNKFGRVRAGNLSLSAAYFTLADYISMHNHDTGTSADAFYLAAGGNPRMTNSVAYNTPSFNGLVLEAQFSAGEGQPGRKRAEVLAANYDRGALHLGASYVNGGSVSMPFVGTTPDNKEYGVRALYEMGPVTLGAYYVRNKADFANASYTRNAYRLAGMYTFGANELHLNVGYADNVKNVAGDTKALQYTVAYNYNLSKRTKVYAFYTRIDNKANASYSLGFNNGNVTAGTDPSAVAIGVRHNF